MSTSRRIVANLVRPGKPNPIVGSAISTWPRRTMMQQAAAHVKQFPSQGARMVDSNSKLEEENWDWYSTDVFYPVTIGETFPPRYQVLGKLGFGTRSTVWLCRDLKTDKYVTLKVCEQNSIAARRELAAFEQLHRPNSKHPGAQLVRRLIGTFKIPRYSGDHICLVHDPLGPSIEMLRKSMPDQRLSKPMLQSVIKSVLTALDFLHTEAKMVHTDLQAGNVHLRIEDESVLKAFEQREIDQPSARKAIGNDLIFETRDLKWGDGPGCPILCDFGEARYGQDSYRDPVQPNAYRSPEVIFDIPWTSKIDIWNVGVMTWHMYQNKLLFPATDEHGKYSEEIQLASMAARLGSPPLDLLFKAKQKQKYHPKIWEAATKSPERSFEASAQYLDDAERDLFCKFIRKMVQWSPERRQTAKQLLDDPWLNS